MSQAAKESQGIVEVTVRPGQPVTTACEFPATESDWLDLGRQMWESPKLCETNVQMRAGITYAHHLKDEARQRCDRFGCCGQESTRYVKDFVSRRFDGSIISHVTVVRCPWHWTCPKGNIGPFLRLFGVLNK